MSNKKQTSNELSKKSSHIESQSKKTFSGNLYLSQVLQLFSHVKEYFKHYQTNKQFTINQFILNQQINKNIVKSFFQEQKLKIKQKKEEDQNEQLFINEWDYKQKPDELMVSLLKHLNNYIQKKQDRQDKKQKFNIVQGDFDIILGSQNKIRTQTIINQFIKQRQKQQKEQIIWIKEDYLGVKNFLNIDQNKQAKYIFQLKKNPFGEIEKKQKFYDWKKQFQINDKNIKQNKSLSFIQQFQLKLIENNMLQNISQIIKLVYATVFSHYQEEERKSRLSYQEYLNLRIRNQTKYQKNINQSPVIVVYYVLNSKVTKQQFDDKFQFFTPLLRHIFIQNRAILNIIGYSRFDKFQLELQKLKQSERLRKEQVQAFSKKLNQQERLRKEQVQALQKKLNQQERQIQQLKKMIKKQYHKE